MWNLWDIRLDIWDIRFEIWDIWGKIAFSSLVRIDTENFYSPQTNACIALTRKCIKYAALAFFLKIISKHEIDKNWKFEAALSNGKIKAFHLCLSLNLVGFGLEWTFVSSIFIIGQKDGIVPPAPDLSRKFIWKFCCSTSWNIEIGQKFFENYMKIFLQHKLKCCNGTENYLKFIENYLKILLQHKLKCCNGT